MLREVFYITKDVRSFGDKFQALAIHDIEPLWEDILEGEGRGKSLLMLRQALSQMNNSISTSLED